MKKYLLENATFTRFGETKTEEAVLRSKLEYFPVEQIQKKEVIQVSDEAGMRCLKRLFSETVSYGLNRTEPTFKEAKSHMSSSQFLPNRNDSCSRVVVEANEDYSPDAKIGSILHAWDNKSVRKIQKWTASVR